MIDNRILWNRMLDSAVDLREAFGPDKEFTRSARRIGETEEQWQKRLDQNSLLDYAQDILNKKGGD